MAWGSLEAKTVNISSSDYFRNETGHISAEKVYIAAAVIHNYGDIFADYGVYLSGENEIKNGFGGKILAKEIALVSDGLVFNGSGWFEGDFEDYIDDIHMPDGYTYEPFLDFNNIDTSNNESIIWGEFVEIYASSFVAVNPYEKNIPPEDKDLPFILDPGLSNQVVVSADYHLKIDVENTFLNRSAVVESVYGSFNLNSSKIENERDFAISTSTVEIPGENTVVHTDYISRLSPAGRISSGSNLVISADSLFNNSSTIEVFGALDANVRLVDMVGKELQKESVKTIYTRHSQRICSKRKWGACVDRTTNRWTTSKEVSESEKLGDIPFVMYLEGALPPGFGYEAFKMNGVVQ